MRYIQYYLLLLSIILTLGTPGKSMANAAQPGVWNAGGTVFTMLYPEDSLSFRKVQMQQECIYIQLYKGFAVVKGTYLFRNTSSRPLNFKMGYPVNGIYSGGEALLNQVVLDSMNYFKIRAGENWLPLLQQPHTEYGNINAFSSNWMVWEMTFAAGESQTVEVYFIVNTNKAQIRSGYDTEKRNAFIYLLESGSVWKQPIEKGNFYIQLMDGLQAEDVQGISDGFAFRFNNTQRIFRGSRSYFSPGPKDNLVITYYKQDKNFDFVKSTSQPAVLFDKIDTLSRMPLEKLSYATDVQAKDPYTVSGSADSILPMLLTHFAIYAPYMAGTLGIAILIWAGIRRKKSRRKNNRV